MTKCDTCVGRQSFQRVRPKTTTQSAAAPLERVSTDLIWPISPAVKGGYMYVNKITDELTRHSAFHLTCNKTEAIDSLVCFVQDLAYPLDGRRVYCLRSHGGGEYRAAYFQNYCKQTAIVQE